MPTRRRAHLLLPSPLGLLEYDILEDRAFIGSGKRGGLDARPGPFPQAVAALTRDGDGAFLVKALPGEAAPTIDGADATGRPLADGDRIRIGTDVVLFRLAGNTPVAPAARVAPKEAAPRRSAPEGGRNRGPQRNPIGTALGLVGALLLLVAIVRAVDHLGVVKQAQDSARVALPKVPVLPEGDERRALRELAAIRAYELANPRNRSTALKKYAHFIDRHPNAAEVEAAQERVREITEAWGKSERVRLEQFVEQDLERKQFAKALSRVRAFEEQFGATQAGVGSDQLTVRVRDAATTAWKTIRDEVASLVAKTPKIAHNLLLRRGGQWPLDITADRNILLAEILARIDAAEAGTLRPRTPREGRAPEKDSPTPPRRTPGSPAPLEPGPGEAKDPEDGMAPPPEQAEAQARALWQEAHKLLNAGQYEGALERYERLLREHAATRLVKRNDKKIDAGRYAARVGSQGPAAMLLHGDARMEGKTLVATYQFQQPEELDDFDTTRPFSSERESHVEMRGGKVEMHGTAGLVLNMVFTDVVRVEASVDAHVAHDFGALAVEESDDFRALIFNINNTRFGLKKTADRIEQGGHILWFVGKGVWADADEDAHGYIKIAERSRSKIEDGDRVTIEFERRPKARCEVGFGGKTDGVHLKGNVKGDDGGGMASARVGLFTDSGKVGVRSLTVRGEVDMAWFRRHLGFLVAGDPGPE